MEAGQGREETREECGLGFLDCTRSFQSSM